ncbi:glycoside hydrolase family 16 protein [Frankia sp. AgPm24]|uniref:glycoside hydrolase family 16 protein n=1 Tax=Frankia sp. AgPm24 TaxID=631128 RepID=UPI00200C3C50|nr:glycoside hydrolase family 16 protein [Frankia sp. AgPm24]MCK9925021.1 glycoside hydrolase family 16 protein [Frankia sp. AgPm24]
MPVPTRPVEPVPGGGANPRFADEFDGLAGAAPDSAVWSPTVGDRWGANEVQCYTASPNNIRLDGSGHLLLSANREPSCKGRSYSSGRVETRGKQTWKYGYFEVRAKLPTGAGMFPAIWMLGPNGVTEWPRSGETDIVEIISSKPGTIHTNVHGVDAEGAHWEAGWSGTGRSLDYAGAVSDTFHTYGLDWTATGLRFYFDDKLIRTLSRGDVPVWLWDQPFYMILNAAVGSYGGSPDAGAFPQTMTVDYVRVYSSKPTA